MAQGVCESFAKGDRRVERVVDSLEEIRDDAPRDRKVIAQEALRSLKKRECVSNLLAIVDELALVRAQESGKTQQALRIMGKESLGAAEQDDRSIQRTAI